MKVRETAVFPAAPISSGEKRLFAAIFVQRRGSFLCLFVQRLTDPLQRLLQFLAGQRKIDADKLPIGISEGCSVVDADPGLFSKNSAGCARFRPLQSIHNKKLPSGTVTVMPGTSRCKRETSMSLFFCR